MSLAIEIFTNYVKRHYAPSSLNWGYWFKREAAWTGVIPIDSLLATSIAYAQNMVSLTPHALAPLAFTAFDPARFI